MGESIGLPTGEGDGKSISLVTTKAGLCGRGDISIMSIAGAGEDGGKGGVVMTLSTGSAVSYLKATRSHT